MYKRIMAYVLTIILALTTPSGFQTVLAENSGYHIKDKKPAVSEEIEEAVADLSGAEGDEISFRWYGPRKGG